MTYRAHHQGPARHKRPERQGFGLRPGTQRRERWGALATEGMYGGFMGSNGNLWDFIEIYGGLMGFYGNLWDLIRIYGGLMRFYGI